MSDETVEEDITRLLAPRADWSGLQIVDVADINGAEYSTHGPSVFKSPAALTAMGVELLVDPI